MQGRHWYWVPSEWLLKDALFVGEGWAGLWQLENKTKWSFSSTFENNDAYCLYSICTLRVISVHGEDQNTFVSVALYFFLACSINIAKEENHQQNYFLNSTFCTIHTPGHMPAELHVDGKQREAVSGLPLQERTRTCNLTQGRRDLGTPAIKAGIWDFKINIHFGLLFLYIFHCMLAIETKSIQEQVMPYWCFGKAPFCKQ